MEPYTPLTVADTFTGATEVRNGVLKIAGEWVIDEDAIEAGFPLKAVDGAGIAFAEGATLTLPGVDAPMSLDGKAILFADENSTISGADNLTFVKSGANWRAVWSADRKTLVLKQSGLVISVR